MRSIFDPSARLAIFLYSSLTHVTPTPHHFLRSLPTSYFYFYVCADGQEVKKKSSRPLQHFSWRVAAFTELSDRSSPADQGLKAGMMVPEFRVFFPLPRFGLCSFFVRSLARPLFFPSLLRLPMTYCRSFKTMTVPLRVLLAF